MDRKPCNNGFYFMDSYLYKPVTMQITLGILGQKSMDTFRKYSSSLENSFCNSRALIWTVLFSGKMLLFAFFSMKLQAENNRHVSDKFNLYEFAHLNTNDYKAWDKLCMQLFSHRENKTACHTKALLTCLCIGQSLSL